MKEALSYDIRILPYGEIADILDKHETVMRISVSRIFGWEVTDREWNQVKFPGPLGGFGVRVPACSADAAYVATYQATDQRVKE
eukprot:5812955-Karenia_brevis.AAC.1